MYSESRELSKFRAELIQGGFTDEESYNLVATYFEAKLDTRQTEEGMVYLTSEQVDLGEPET